MRWRFLGAAMGCVARAGVDVLARRTGVRVRLVLAVAEVVFFLAAGRLLAAVLLLVEVRLLLVEGRFLLAAVRFLLAAVRFLLFAVLLEALLRFGVAAAFRDVERTEPFVFLREPAAFNCFPLFGLWPQTSSRTLRSIPGPLLYQRILAEGVTGIQLFFETDPEFWTGSSNQPKWILHRVLAKTESLDAKRTFFAPVRLGNGPVPVDPHTL